MTAVACACVETEKGLFCGTADASPENTNSIVGRHLVALAETRAKARALRDAINIGVVSLEELVGDESTDNGGTMSTAQHRYILRLLAGRGITGESATGFLSERLGPEPERATRTDASAIIDELTGQSPHEASPSPSPRDG